MLWKLLFLFITVPLVELALLLYLADHTSWRFTLGLVIVTGIAGSWLAGSQGWRTLLRLHADLADGRMPTDALFDGALILVAAGLLLTPGMLTDVIGILLLIPWTRSPARRWLVAWLKGKFHLHAATLGPGSNTSDRSDVIDSYVVDAPPPDRERLP